MSDYDFDRMKEYHLIDKRFAYAPRKRVPHNGHRNNFEEETQILINGDIDGKPSDPEYSDLLKEYDSDDSEEREKELQMLRMQANLKPMLSQGATYLLLLAFITVFVLLVNWYNVKQLAQLKEEYGLDERRPAPEFWWHKALIYHIYVHSFQDSNGDGIGDINGIRQRLDYLTYLGVDAVLLSAFYDSPFEHLGRDVRDFSAIGTKYGSIEDFELLIKDLHRLGIKLIIELIPNHTSRRHKWFLQSRQSASNPYSKFYIWDNGRRSENGSRYPPNNWVSKYGGPAWTFDEVRQQYYYHYYHSSMPDLNMRHEDVRNEIMNIFQFWLDKGIDALSINDIHTLYESDDTGLDEPTTEDETLPGEHRSLSHIFTEWQPEVHDLLGSWRDFIETYSLQSGRRIGLMVNTANTVVTEAVKYYFTGSDLPIAPALLGIKSSCNAQCIHDAVDAWMTHVPEDYDALWMMSSPDDRRSSNGKGLTYQSTLNMLAMLLPGATLSYYGEEIGLLEMQPDDDTIAKYTSQLGRANRGSVVRALSRAPMLWSSASYAGFTTASSPWLPVHPSYHTTNVEVQKNDARGRSPLQIYHRLSHLRKDRSFLSNKLQFLVVNNNILSFMRFTRDTAPYLIALNLGDRASTDDYTVMTGMVRGKVVLYSGTTMKVEDGDLVTLSALTLEPGEGIVAMLVLDEMASSLKV